MIILLSYYSFLFFYIIYAHSYLISICYLLYPFITATTKVALNLYILYTLS
ncbi:hypothetical protein GLYMA_11G204000v4 [Glycine max]|uniref:Uncharacterized protein n=1 Tax=Glycine max TaxID=3847 RepID=K7LR95_SOYBN|nr:hypothetical protein JHK87_031808 [Glycine soja]KAH1160055.1 hypothetical protein GYH30_031703 [Glycine max]KRH30738.1 hypothetical protein GLYMA_11G204000v4 [Glycine max]